MDHCANFSQAVFFIDMMVGGLSTNFMRWASSIPQFRCSLSRSSRLGRILILPLFHPPIPEQHVTGTPDQTTGGSATALEQGSPPENHRILLG